MSDETAEHRADVRDVFVSAERAKAFIDAVVAIAMTLLILPLMESVNEVAGGHEGGSDAGAWFAAHWPQVMSFVLSFVLIAMFWLTNHRLYAHVEQVSSGFLWIAVGWLLTIVWLPVATAMTSQLDGEAVKVVYIGSMIAPCLLSLLQRIYLARHPQLHRISHDGLRSGMAVDVAMALLFATALLITAIVPGLGYLPLFVMFLVPVLHKALAHLFGVGRAEVDTPGR